MGLRIMVVGIAALLGCHRMGLDSGDAARRAEGERLWATSCIGCHTRGKIGTPIAPDLADIHRKFSVDALARWLRNPEAQAPSTHMPRLELTEREINALVTYLTSP